MEITPLEPWIKGKIGSLATGVDLREGIDRHQLHKLRETIDFAVSRSPFYRGHLAGIKGADLQRLDDIARLPFTTAGDILENDLRFVCVSQDEIARVVTLNTSGTSAQAKRIHFTEDDLELTIDLFHHGMKALVRPGQRVLVLMPGDRHGSIGDLMVKALKRMGVEGFVHGVVRDDSAAISEIVDKEIDCLIGIPVQVLGLIRHGDAAAIPQGRISSVLSSADYVPAAVVREISRAWGCAVFNHYGMTEMGLGAAVDCRALSGYHIREADLYFEIIDPASGLPVPDGEMGEVVFSTLTRKGMPLIRYRTGDLSRFIPEPCQCGTVLKRLEWVRGRLEGAVSLANGSRLSMADLDEALFPLTGILNFQVVIDRENGKDQLNLTIYGRNETTGDVTRQARRALENVTAVRAALDMGALTVASVGTGMENWISTGSIKRKILDRREEM